MKAAVYISSGLGNAITLIPLVNALKKRGYKVSGIFTSEFGCEHLFENSDLFDEKIVIHSKWSAIKESVKSIMQFDVLFADRFASTKNHFILARMIAKKIIAQHNPDPEKKYRKIQFVYPQANTHSIHLNLNMAKEVINVPSKIDMSFHRDVDKRKHIVFQPGSGNNKTPWKSWLIESWIEVLKKIDYPITVIGDKNEQALIDVLNNSGLNNLDIRIGKTEIAEMTELVASSQLFIGHDSGPMHIAVACKVPTFTLWGGSNSRLYGYESVFPHKHKVIQHMLSCSPCDSWFEPNTARVNHPEKCPDFKCIKEIRTEYVINVLKEFLRSIESEITIK